MEIDADQSMLAKFAGSELQAKLEEQSSGGLANTTKGKIAIGELVKEELAR